MRHTATALKSLVISLMVFGSGLGTIYSAGLSDATENYYQSVQNTERYTQSCYPAVVFEQEHLAEDDYFIDIDFSPARDEITFLGAMGIIEGTGNNRFTPNGDLTRAEYLKMVFLAFAHEIQKDSWSDQYSDVTEEHWAADLIATATDLDIINGYANGTFQPDQQITYVEAIKIAARATNCDFWAEELEENGVAEQGWSKDWYEGYMAWADENDIYTPSANDPDFQMARWNGAKLTYDVMEYVNASLGISMRVIKHV